MKQSEVDMNWALYSTISVVCLKIDSDSMRMVVIEH
jgi:hypothetical protein